jgi:F-type H+-transporting ATPase subunit delta
MSQLAVRYAKALVDILDDPKHSPQASAVLDQLQSFAAAFAASTDLRRAFASPAVPRASKRALVQKFAGEFQFRPITSNFLSLVNRHDRMGDLPAIMKAVSEEADRRQGILRAKVTAAMPLADEQARSLEAELARVMNRQVRCEHQSDPALLGGVTVRIGSKVYDGSVRGQLNALKRQLGGRAA